jgi:hypothetical protein
MGRLYGPAGKFYGRGRGPEGFCERRRELTRGLASREELVRRFARGRELGRLDGQRRKLDGLAGRLGGVSG